MDLKNKNVVYVGGFGGIGFASCKSFLSKRIANLSIVDVKKDFAKLRELETEFPGINIFFTKCDLTDKANVTAAYREAIDKMGHIDVVVNGSGIMDDRQIELTIQINLLGLIYSTLTAISYMDKSMGGKGGVIVNISSIAGLEPLPSNAIYAAAKHGVIGFTRSLSHKIHYNQTGVKFVAFCPGVTETPLSIDPVGRDTFDYCEPVTKELSLAKKQKPEQCAQRLTEVVEIGKNGTIWINDLGDLKEVKMPVFWKPTF